MLVLFEHCVELSCNLLALFDQSLLRKLHPVLGPLKHAFHPLFVEAIALISLHVLIVAVADICHERYCTCPFVSNLLECVFP